MDDTVNYVCITETLLDGKGAFSYKVVEGRGNCLEFETCRGKTASIKRIYLDNVWEMKPLLDGKAIMGVLQLKSGGPLIREWQERLIKWQLAHPEGTTEECLDWMQQSQAKRVKLDCCA